MNNYKGISCSLQKRELDYNYICISYHFHEHLHIAANHHVLLSAQDVAREARLFCLDSLQLHPSTPKNSLLSAESLLL